MIQYSLLAILLFSIFANCKKIENRKVSSEKEIYSKELNLPTVDFKNGKAKVISKNGLILRSRPSILGKKIITIPFDTIVPIDNDHKVINEITIDKEKSSDWNLRPWYRVEFKNNTGWVFSGYLEPTQKSISFKYEEQPEFLRDLTYFKVDAKIFGSKEDIDNFNRKRYKAKPKTQHKLSTTKFIIEIITLDKNINLDMSPTGCYSYLLISDRITKKLVYYSGCYYDLSLKKLYKSKVIFGNFRQSGESCSREPRKQIIVTKNDIFFLNYYDSYAEGYCQFDDDGNPCELGGSNEYSAYFLDAHQLVLKYRIYDCNFEKKKLKIEPEKFVIINFAEDYRYSITKFDFDKFSENLVPLWL